MSILWSCGASCRLRRVMACSAWAPAKPSSSAAVSGSVIARRTQKAQSISPYAYRLLRPTRLRIFSLSDGNILRSVDANQPHDAGFIFGEWTDGKISEHFLFKTCELGQHFRRHVVVTSQGETSL